MTFQPLIPWPALAVAGVALLGFVGWRILAAGRSPGAGRPAWLRRAAIVAVVLLIGAGPATTTSHMDERATNLDVFFVVDRTGSMAAEDYDGARPRLNGVRTDVDSLVKALPGARYSVISFDSTATRQLPLTTDAAAVTAWTATMHQETTRLSVGSLTDRPYGVLADALTSSKNQRPGNVRLVFFFSDGEQTAPGVPESFAPLAAMVDGGAVLGYGTATGGRMQEYEPGLTPPTPQYIKDESKPLDSAAAAADYPDAISKIDEKTLRTLAGQLGVAYEHRTAPGDTSHLVQGLDAKQIALDGRRKVHAHQAFVWPLALALTVLLAWEAWGWAGSYALTRRRS